MRQFLMEVLASLLLFPITGKLLKRKKQERVSECLLEFSKCDSVNLCKRYKLVRNCSFQPDECNPFMTSCSFVRIHRWHRRSERKGIRSMDGVVSKSVTLLIRTSVSKPAFFLPDP